MDENINPPTQNLNLGFSSAVASANDAAFESRRRRFPDSAPAPSYPPIEPQPKLNMRPHHSTVPHIGYYYDGIDVIHNSVSNVNNNSKHNYGAVDTIDQRTITNNKNTTRNVYINSDAQLSGDSIQQWQLPSPTEIFTGRDGELEEMRKCFGIQTSPDEQNASEKRQVFVIYGLGGSGKTQLALKFAQMHSSWFWKIFYIDASNPSILEAHLTSMAKQFGAGETAEVALAKLLAPPRNWLLIFDNADDTNFNLEEYFPKGNHGYIIITTRNKGCISHALRSNINLTHFPSEDAVTLLLKAAMLEVPYDNATLESANLLAKGLGYLPLAISQAGAYIRQNSTLAEYLQLFNERRKQILSWRNGNIQDKDLPVYATWDISYQRLDDSAKHFLFICAFLHHMEIPKFIFQKGIPLLVTNNFNSPIRDTLNFLRWGKFRPKRADSRNAILRGHWMNDGKWDTWKFNHTVTQLTSYSLISVSDRYETSLFSLHELVKCWVRDNLDKKSSIVIRKMVTKIFCLSIPGSGSALDPKHWRLLLPHAIVVDGMLADGLEIDPNEMLHLAKVYYENGRWRKAGELFAQVKQVLKRTLGKEHTDTLEVMNTLAVVYRRLGRWGESEELLIEVLECYKRIFGKGNSRSLFAVGNLANIYSNQGKWTEAGKLKIEVAGYYERILGKDHLHTLSAMHNLATMYTNQGRLAEAKELQIEVVQRCERVLGQDHRCTLFATSCLAEIYSAYGQWTEAEKLQKEALKSCERVLGKDHPDTLPVINNLAKTYSFQGRWAEAEELQKEVLESYKTILGKDHEHTLLVIHNLAATYSFQGRWAEAEKLQIEVLENYKRILGKDHRRTLSAMHNLASTYLAQEQWTEAENLQMEAVEGCERILSKDHPDTLIAVHNLAFIYLRQERWTASEKLQIEALERHRRILGKDCPDTLSAVSSLAVTYRCMGRWAEAERLLIEALEGFKRVLGKGHLRTLFAMNQLAKTYSCQKQWAEAEKLQIEVVRCYERILGKDHLDTLSAISGLANIYNNQEQWAEAEKLQIEVIGCYERILGKGHLCTLSAIKDLARIYRNQGQWAEVGKLQKEILERILGIGHPGISLAMRSRATVYVCRVKAEKLLTELPENQNRVLTKDHLDIPPTTMLKELVKRKRLTELIFRVLISFVFCFALLIFCYYIIQYPSDWIKNFPHR